MAKIDSHLDDRSKLSFYYPGVSRPRILNFMENIKVSESSQGSYSEYNPIGRNGSVFVYLGSKSRKLQIDFGLTLPNIMQFTRFPYKKTSEAIDEKFQLRNDYFELVGKETENKTSATAQPTGSAFLANSKKPSESLPDYVNSFDLEYLSLLDEYELSETVMKIGLENAQGLLASNKGAVRNLRTEALAKTMQWVNLIRSSVLTNANSPSDGPPIVRLTHGILYQSVPCIVDNYSISFNPDVTYDQRTLLPREIKVSMNLREVRTSYTDFKPGDPIKSDGIPGWNNIIDNVATLDPVAYKKTEATSLKTGSNDSQSNTDFLVEW